MSIRIALTSILLATLACQAHAQFKWPEGKLAAVVLTYDDALSSQLDVAIPQLDSAGFKGTFFSRRRPHPGRHASMAQG